MVNDPSQLPPVARVVRGGGSARERFVANAKPKVAAAGQVAGFALRTGFTIACFVGIVAAIGSSKSKSSYSSYDLSKYRFDYTPPKFDFKKFEMPPPKFDFSKMQNFDLQRSIELQKSLDALSRPAHEWSSLPAYSQKSLPTAETETTSVAPAPTPKATPAPGTSRLERTRR